MTKSSPGGYSKTAHEGDGLYLRRFVDRNRLAQDLVMTKTIIINIVGLFFCWASSVLAAWFTVFRPRNREWAALLSVAAITVSGMAFTTWTPFGRFPEIGYTWSDDDGSVRIFLRSGWLYLFPAAMAAIALLWTLWKQRTKHRRGCHAEDLIRRVCERNYWASVAE